MVEKTTSEKHDPRDSFMLVIGSVLAFGAVGCMGYFVVTSSPNHLIAGSILLPFALASLVLSRWL